jgi:hypothetical protein
MSMTMKATYYMFISWRIYEFDQFPIHFSLSWYKNTCTGGGSNSIDENLPDLSGIPDFLREKKKIILI